MMYAYNENFILPLSHDEVVYGKGSLIEKMPGDYGHKFAGMRALLGYMYTQPGKKLLFMGGEFGQWAEWNHDASLDWALLDFDSHAHLRLLVGELNHLYRTEPALRECDVDPHGFEWIDCSDAEKNIISYMRKGKERRDMLLVVCHFSPVLRTNYRIGAPARGYWQEILNTDAPMFGGSRRWELRRNAYSSHSTARAAILANDHCSAFIGTGVPPPARERSVADGRCRSRVCCGGRVAAAMLSSEWAYGLGRACRPSSDLGARQHDRRSWRSACAR
jgi:1,4-alpha-glucan branching enzyme